jgi:hypothetical protein
MDIAQIVKALGGTGAVSRLCGTSLSVVSMWKRRGTIPAEYWQKLVSDPGARNAGVDYELLARLHAKQKATS